MVISMKKKRKLELTQSEKKQKDNNKIILGYIVLIVCLLLTFILSNLLEEKQLKQALEKAKREEIFSNIKANYNQYINVIEEATIYKLEDNKYVPNGSISEGAKLELEEKIIKDYNDIYFKLKYQDNYIKYTSVEPTEEFKRNYTYKNYLPFNINVITNKEAILYSDEGEIYKILEELSLPIIIKETDRYYVEYDNRLLYVKKDEIKNVIESNNNQNSIATSIATVLYHYVDGSPTNRAECKGSSICHSYEQVDSHFNYLKENNYYTLKMRDMDLWIDGKIQLPQKSVLISIDDGWYIDGFKDLLQKYELNATLFLITSLIPAGAAVTEFLELHSHTHDLHKVGVCPGGQGSPLKCIDRNTILTDLKKSREILWGSTYFAYPLYEYNQYTIDLLKEAGFTMAFKGGMYKATQGIDKFLVPRITIHSTTSLNKFVQYIS